MIALARTVARARAEAVAKRAGKGVDKGGLVRCPACEREGKQAGRQAGRQGEEPAGTAGLPRRCPECVDLDGYVRWVPDQELLAWGIPLIELSNRIERYGLGEVERVWGEIDPLGLLCVEMYEQVLEAPNEEKNTAREGGAT